MADHIQSFVAFMDSHGCCPARSSDIRPDGKWHDIELAGDRRGKKKGYYILKIDGDFSSGACGDRREATTHQWTGKPERVLTNEERREWAKRREADRRLMEREKARQAKEARDKATAIWEASVPATGQEAYLKRKGVAGIGARVWRGVLALPVRIGGEITSIQLIDAQGGKRFLRGGEIKGGYTAVNKSRDMSVIWIAEGYATAHSVWDATGQPCIVAFNAGNLVEVARVLREKYPGSRLIIAADNDSSGTGEVKAKATGLDYIMPPEVDTDWNDYARAHGAEKLREALREFPQRNAEDAPPQGWLESLPPIEAYEQDASRERRAVAEWKDLLICNSEGKLIKSSLKNYILFLENHEDFRGVFRMNDFQKEIFVTRCPIWESESGFEVHRLEDNDTTQAAAAMERFGLNGDTDKVFKAIRVAAENIGFHPAREYFSALQWDRKERLKNWLTYYMGAEGDDPEYLSFIGLKWMTAAVKRVFEPGCKFDHILVVEGKQGKGKSTALEKLATFGRDKEKAYFTDNIKLSDIQNKDTILLLQGSIIIEVAEMAGFSKKEDDEIRGWITVKEDRCRVPYGKTITHFPRQFVLAGTTNNYDYLKDPTGNRRYWPFKSTSVDIAAIEQDREQLWAEAMHWYKSGLYIGPTEEEMLLAEAAQEKRRTHDTWEDDVLLAIGNLGLTALDGFNTRQIFREMGLGLKDQDFRNTRRITNILTQNGYENTVKRIGGKTRRVWVKE